MHPQDMENHKIPYDECEGLRTQMKLMEREFLKTSLMCDSMRQLLVQLNEEFKRMSPTGTSPISDQVDWLVTKKLGAEGWLSPEKAQRLREALRNCIEHLEEVRTGEDFECQCWDAAEKAKQALEETK